MGFHGCLVLIGLAEGKEIGLFKLPTYLKTQATWLFAGGDGVLCDDFQKLIHPCWVDFQDNDDIDHEALIEPILR